MIPIATAYSRGHKIIYLNEEWVYADNEIPLKTEERPCIRCGRMPSPEGYDACLGYINGVKAACCGHGVTDPYIILAERALG